MKHFNENETEYIEFNSALEELESLPLFSVEYKERDKIIIGNAINEMNRLVLENAELKHKIKYPKWVDIEKENILPRQFEKVLVTCEDTHLNKSVKEAYLNRFKQWQFSHGVDEYLKVIAWCEYPKYYEKE